MTKNLLQHNVSFAIIIALRFKVSKRKFVSKTDDNSHHTTFKMSSSCSFSQNDIDIMASKNPQSAKKRKREVNKDAAAKSKISCEASNWGNSKSADTAAKEPKMAKKKVGNRKKTELRLEEWIESEAPKNVFIENEIVLATIPGYAPWPARILSINSETIFVDFFGTGQM